MKHKVKHEYWLDYGPMDRAFLSLFKSPSAEASTFKGIPMDKFRMVMKLLPSKGRRIKFRGKSTPAYRRPRAHIIKKYAETFAVYFPEHMVLHLGRP